jgi:hypothetical protein
MNLSSSAVGPGRRAVLAAAGLLLLGGAAAWAAAAGGFIPADDVGEWRAEIFIGSPDVRHFLQGAALEGGVEGIVEIDGRGNAYVACGSFIQLVTREGTARILTGSPGVTGSTDGPPWKATFGCALDLALAADDLLYVADAGNFTVREVRRGPDGIWTTTTLAGVPGQRGHRDGPGKQALFTAPLDSVAVDEKGTVYVLDGDWLRRIENGAVTTLNAGTGRKNGPLAEARFDRIMAGRHCLAYAGGGCFYVADRWGMAVRKVDLAAGEVSTVAGCLPDAAKDRPRDGKALEARFHPGGGPVAVFYDRKHERILVRSADEGGRIRAVKDGWVKTWGGLPGTGKGPLVGDWSKCRGGSPLGVDRDGNVYVSGNGCIRKVSRHEGGAR